jgi:hypothetical protein
MFNKMIYSEIKNIKHWTRVDIANTKLEEEKTNVPNKAGLYLIYTNTPTSVFKSLRSVNIYGAVDIGTRTKNSLTISNELLIKEDTSKNYCVYIGHHSNLRQRFKEHFLGSKGTGCLSIFKHNKLKKFKWSFYYLEISKLADVNDSNLFRTILESELKSNFGWPVLCAR